MGEAIQFEELRRALIALGAKVEAAGFHRMHHSNAAKIWTWKEQKQKTFTITYRQHRFALRLTYETHINEAKNRVILFGKELFGRQLRAGNTARATFNSTNFTADGYFLKPTLALGHKAALRAQLSARAGFPKWVGDHLQLEKGSTTVVLISFLQALSIIEAAKKMPKDLLQQLGSNVPEFTREDLDGVVFDEGKSGSVTRTVRQRSAQLRKLAADYYRANSADGRLRCYVNDWTPDVPVRGEIIQIHHDEALADYPKQGRSLRFSDAIKFLFPLCPNCHRLLEAKPGGGRYTIPELRNLLQRPVKSK